jgi:AcrR family transcriptional regulator
MGRKQTIDRGQLLDAAERVVLRDGAGQLTMDAVAAEAGVSKGGVLYAYPSKDALIDALFQRAFLAFEAIGNRIIAERGDSPHSRALAHVVAGRGEDDASTGHIIALIVNFMRSPRYRQEAQAYYRSVLDQLDLTTVRGRRARLAILAAEGAMVLRGFEFYPLSEADWQAIHADIIELLLGD